MSTAVDRIEIRQVNKVREELLNAVPYYKMMKHVPNDPSGPEMS